MTVKQQIKYHLANKKFCKVKRKVGKDCFEYTNGYIVDSASNFLLLQEVEDFRVLGYMIFPISTITEIRQNDNDKYYDKIMRWEKQIDQVVNKHEIDLTNWPSIFNTIKETGLNVIIENENPEDKSFDIGPIIKTTKTAVYIQYFNARGYLDKEITKITFNKITNTKFDDRYINVFSKYLRHIKPK